MPRNEKNDDDDDVDDDGHATDKNATECENDALCTASGNNVVDLNAPTDDDDEADGADSNFGNDNYVVCHSATSDNATTDNNVEDENNDATATNNKNSNNFASKNDVDVKNNHNKKVR